ncbi:hypothetical protein WKR88_02465 [Trinickia caryophylli]|uniref:Uncharacterized protein n=2 Tax=Trinickia caryophylli TaxID=28094 RepID=A0A1X7DVD7_TRICW|nr:hypothetical protein [Trinickia caryophylli]PMS14265.1 hypothetical protein C0Z17_01715 [Trinickia caryophylli]TRX17963.1 hypothetical protein FNF07_06830 [Trinickia caryophylli]GLU32407.1 hypothetical protein Busp01_22490 [Trinickia caryophylli]SMF22537.1 hypothetical protein SAMN06295900_10496 [Trinickia caryophylli]
MSDSKLRFAYPQPFTPLLVGPGGNKVTVQLTPREDQALRGQPIQWKVEPSGSISLGDGPQTQTLKDGTTANFLSVPEPVDDLVTVSVWDGSQPDAAHYTTLFQCVVPRVWGSMDTNIVPTTPPATTPGSNQLITATATVVDDSSAPVRGLLFYWTGSPATPTSAYRVLPLGLEPVAGQADGYPCVTDDSGMGGLAFANTRPTIILLGIATNTTQRYLVAFSDVAKGIGKLPPLIVPLGDGNVLDLDSQSDPLGVPIFLDPTLSSTQNYVMVWLNGVIAAVGYPGKDYTTTPLYVPKNYFKNEQASNLIGAVISNVAGNGGDTGLLQFPAKGDVPVIEPPQRIRTLEAPTLVRGVGGGAVNQSTLSGGLQIWIPAYDHIDDGDKIQIRMYLQGYFAGTTIKRYGLVQMEVTTSYGDVDDGLLVVANEADFAGYDVSSMGDVGVLQIEYIVDGDEYSKLLTRPFSYAGLGAQL